MKVSIEYKKATGGVRRGLDLCDQNGQRVTTIFPGQTQEIDTPTELLSLYGKMDWAKTEVLELSGSTECVHILINQWFTLNPLRILGLMQLPISVEQVRG